MSNDPKEPTKGDDQQSDAEGGEISAEDLKKVAGGRSLNYIGNYGGNLAAKTSPDATRDTTGQIRKK